MAETDMSIYEDPTPIYYPEGEPRPNSVDPEGEMYVKPTPLGGARPSTVEPSVPGEHDPIDPSPGAPQRDTQTQVPQTPPSTFHTINYKGRPIQVTQAELEQLAAAGLELYTDSSGDTQVGTAPEKETPVSVGPDGQPLSTQDPHLTKVLSDMAEQGKLLTEQKKQLDELRRMNAIQQLESEFARATQQSDEYKKRIGGVQEAETAVRNQVYQILSSNGHMPVKDALDMAVKQVIGLVDVMGRNIVQDKVEAASRVPKEGTGQGATSPPLPKLTAEDFNNGVVEARAVEFLERRMRERE